MTISYPDEELVEQLLTLIGHSNPNVRAGAAIALGRLRAVNAVETLVEMLNDPVYRVHRSAARAIGLIGSRAVGVVLATLQENPGATLRQRLADSLGFIRDPEAVEILAAAVNYLVPPARYGALDALSAIGHAAAIPALLQAVRSEDPLSRLKAAQALQKINAPEAIHAFAGLLDQADVRLRIPAIQGIGEIGGEQAVLSLLSFLDDEDENVAQATAAALCEIDSPEALEIFLTTINSASTWVQKSIADLLSNYREDRVVERLMALLAEQGDLETRLTAAKSLALIGDARGTAMILRTLNAPNIEIRQSASIALGLTGDARAINPFVQSIRQKTIDPGTPRGRYLRRRMIQSMTAIGAEAVEPMIELLVDKDAFVSRLAWDVLERMGETAVEPLIVAMKYHRNQQVRTNAAHLLGRIGDARAAEPLSDILRKVLIGPYPIVFLGRLFYDPGSMLRAAAANSLGKISSPDGASLLISAARYDPDHAVNQAAELALARLGSPTGIVRLAQADVTGFVNHVMASSAVITVLGVIAALVSRLWGIPDAALLAGLGAGAGFGYVDGLEGHKRPAQGALVGGLVAVLLAWLLAGVREPWMISTAGVIFPVVGSFLGWDRKPLVLRLAGLFGGIVLGFAGAGVLLLILGTIG